MSCDYSYAQIPLATGGAVWVALELVTAAWAVSFLLFQRNRTAFFVAASAVLVFLPTSNLIFPLGTIMAERFLYLPSIAFAAGLVWGAYSIGPRVAPAALCVVIAGLGVRTYARNADWENDLTLSAAAVRVSPNSFKAHKLRANALLESDPRHGNIDRVIEEAEKSLAVLDPLPDARNNADMYQRAGEYYFMKGDRERQRHPDGGWVTPVESVLAYQRTIQLLQRCEAIARASGGHVDYANLEQLRVKLYLRLDQPTMALEAAVRARALDPENPGVHREIAGLLLSEGREEAAAVALIEGVLITQDAGLRREMPERNEGTRTQFCAAAAAAMRLRLETHRRELAAGIKSTAVREFGCPAGPLEEILK
jgi:tetratricopeptide (TPR) repeat protein